MSRLLALLAAAAGSVHGATLLASHYNGQIYTLALDVANGSLAVASQTAACGTTPGWLELYSDTKTLYCFDESWSGSGFIASYSVAADGKLSKTAQVPTTGNDVHGALYGGADGRSFVAAVQ